MQIIIESEKSNEFGFRVFKITKLLSTRKLFSHVNF